MPGYDPVARQQAANAATVANQALALSELAQAVVAAQNWVVVNSNTTAADNAHLSVNTGAAPVTIGAPPDGAPFSLRDDAGTWGTHAVTVLGNGANFAFDGAGTFVLDAPGFQIDFTMIGAAWHFTLQFLNGAA